MASQIPKVMEGVIIRKTGGTEVLEFKTDLPVPSLREGEILLKNDFVGINYIDTYFRAGLFPVTSFPFTLGRESSGTIIATGTGNTYGLKEGDRVVVLSQSTYAQYTAAPALHAYKIPDGVSIETTAAVLLQGLTGLTMIKESYYVNSGDWILVHAAAGGVGLLLLQMLKSVGAKVIATCSTSKIPLVRKYQPELIIDYTVDNFVAKVKDVTDGLGVTAVFDGVGKATFDGSLECLAKKGTFVSFGNASGSVSPFNIVRLSQKNARLLRPTVFNYITTREEFEMYVKELFEKFVIEDNMEVKIHKIYAMKDVAQAHLDLEGRKTTGKLLLEV